MLELAALVTCSSLAIDETNSTVKYSTYDTFVEDRFDVVDP